MSSVALRVKRRRREQRAPPSAATTSHLARLPDELVRLVCASASSVARRARCAASLARACRGLRRAVGAPEAWRARFDAELARFLDDVVYARVYRPFLASPERKRTSPRGFHVTTRVLTFYASCITIDTSKHVDDAQKRSACKVVFRALERRTDRAPPAPPRRPKPLIEKPDFADRQWQHALAQWLHRRTAFARATELAFWRALGVDADYGDQDGVCQVTIVGSAYVMRRRRRHVRGIAMRVAPTDATSVRRPTMCDTHNVHPPNYDAVDSTMPCVETMRMLTRGGSDDAWRACCRAATLVELERLAPVVVTRRYRMAKHARVDAVARNPTNITLGTRTRYAVVTFDAASDGIPLTTYAQRYRECFSC